MGLGAELQQALAAYSQTDREQTARDQELAIQQLVARHEAVSDFLSGINWRDLFEGDAGRRPTVLKQTVEYILSEESGRKRYLDLATALASALRPCGWHAGSRALARRRRLHARGSGQSRQIYGWPYTVAAMKLNSSFLNCCPVRWSPTGYWTSSGKPGSSNPTSRFSPMNSSMKSGQWSRRTSRLRHCVGW